VKYIGISYKGRRETNQDSFFSGRINEYTVLAVADGMGGQKGGEIASKIAIDCLVNIIDKEPFASKDSDLKSILKKVYEDSDKAIKNASDATDGLSNMGTTLSCLLMAKGKYVVANIGDSRVYRLTHKEVDCITRDHTILQQYLDEFERPAPEEIKENGHILTKVLDGSGDEPDIYPANKPSFTLNSNDIFLVLSDGLILDKANNFENILYQIVFGSNSIEQISKHLIAHVYHRGSKDNCTVVVGFNGRRIKTLYRLPRLSYPPHLDKNPRITEPEKISKKTGIIILSLLLLAILTLFVLTFRGSFTTIHHSTIEQEPLTGELNNGQTVNRNENNELSWDRGFTNINTNTPYFDGDQIIWYRPEGLQITEYEIIVYQFNELVHTEITSQTSFTLRDNHGYEDGQIVIEVSAMQDNQIIQPDNHSRTTITYNRN